MQYDFPLLAFNDNSYLLVSEDADIPLLADSYINIFEYPRSWGKRLIRKAIEELMVKVADEITDAYENQQL